MRNLTPIFVLTILISLTFTTASGQWSNDPAVNTAVASSAGDKYSEEILADGEGGFIIVWHDFRPGVQADLYAQKLDQNGVPQWTPEGVVVSAAPGHQWGTTLASDGDGGVIVGFHDERSGTSFDIYSQRIDRNGVARWTPNGVPIAVDSTQNEWPAIISDGKGGAIIAWGREGIHAQRVDSSGAIKWAANGIPVCTAGGDQRFPKLVSDGAGGVLVAWLDARTLLDVYMQRIDSSGVVQWALDGVPIVTDGGTHDRPCLISDGSGGAIVAWEDRRHPSLDIYAQRVNGSGAPMWAAEGVPLTLAAGDQTFPFDGFGSVTMIVSDGAGGAIVAWDDARLGNPNVYAQRVSPGGIVQWASYGVPVAVGTSNQGGATLVADGAGGAIVSWVDDRNGQGADLYAQRINQSGNPVWPTDGTPLTTATGIQKRPRMAAHGSGGTVVAWEDTRDSRWGIFAQKIGLDGALGVPLSIQVTSPVTVDEWFTGGSYAVGWTTDSTVDNVDIAISADGGGSWTPVGTGVAANAGTYPITAPTLPVPNREMLIRVRSTADSSVFNLSPRFSLVDDSLDLALVAYFPLDGQPDDLSGYGNDGVPNSPQPGRDRFGHENKAYDFNGVTDRMRVADSPVLRLTGAMTISCWVNSLGFPAGRAMSQLVFRGDDRIAQDPYFLAIMPSNSLRFQVSSRTATDYIETPYTYDGWHHVAAVLDTAAGTMMLIVDGDTAASKSTSVRPFRDLDGSFSPGVGLGNTQSAPFSGNHHPLYGALDEVRIYRRALSPGEVRQLFGSGNHVITASAGPHGTITPAGRQFAEPGSSKRFSFHPFPGYEIEDAFVDDLHVDSTQGYTFENIQAPHTIHVTFAAVFAPLGIRATLNIDNGASSKSIAFGLEAGAGYGIFRVDPTAGAVDSIAGESELPPPAPGSLDARFVEPYGNSALFGGGSWVDVRRFARPWQIDTFRIALQPASPATAPFVVRWLKEYIAGAFEGPVMMDDGSIDMKLLDSAVFPPGKGSIMIFAGRPSLPYRYAEGWNMASIPVDLTVPRGVLFPSVASDAYAFRSIPGYIKRDTLQPSEGFWLKFSELIQELDFPGDSLLTDTIAIDAGWNLIGAMSRPISVSDISTIPEDILPGHFFEYFGAYRATASIDPGKGYWVKATAPGLLIYNVPSGQAGAAIAGVPAPELGSVTIIDALGREQTLYFGEADREIDQFELPPLPPEGSFDVRFAGDVSLLRSGPGGSAGEIRLSGAALPLTIRWRELPGTDAKLELGGAPLDLTGDGEVRLTAIPQSVRLVLKGGDAVPQQFLLSQAWPNPFNPTTSFRVDLPAETRVSMKIYDVLGSVVATLVEEHWSPGSRVVTWNASGTPSGVYYCRIVAGANSDTRKVLLLK